MSGYRGRSEGRGRGRGGDRGRGGRGGRSGPYERDGGLRRQVNPTKLHISNLPENINKRELEQLFETCGKVLECDVIRDFAFVHYGEPEEADKAVNKLHGHMLKGSSINVRHSTSTLRQKPGATKGDCFRCGGRGHDSTECPTTLREQGILPPRYPPLPYDDPYQRYPRPPLRDPYLDPYERLERDPYMRRPLPPLDPYDPYLRDPYARDPYARDPYGRDPYARAALYERDAYGRPPPEFYQKGRGRGKAAMDPLDDLGGELNGGPIKSLLAAAGDSKGGRIGANSMQQQFHKSQGTVLEDQRNLGKAFQTLNQVRRLMSDPYFFNDDYDGNRIPNP